MNPANLWTVPGVANDSMWDIAPVPVEGAVHRWDSRSGKRFGLLTSEGWLGGPRSAVLYAGLAVARNSVLKWQPDVGAAVAGTLLVPTKVGLPAMHDRVATMATGLRPARGITVVKYRGIPTETGRKIADSLGQDLEMLGTHS